MPTCFLMCEGCGTRQAFFFDDAEITKLQTSKTFPKHCLVCRTTTEWAFAFLDRRNGDRRSGDRRQNSDRRKFDPSS